MLYRRVCSRGALCVVLFLASAAARAASLALAFDQSFSGVPPALGAPWLVATFEDAPGATVRLTLSTPGLSGRENVSEVYFNLDPALAPEALAVRYVSGAQALGVTSTADCCRAGSDGRYDLLFGYPTGSGFNAGTSSVYDLSYSGAGAFGAPSFRFLSTPVGGSGPFYAAAHVQNTGRGSGDSAWLAPLDAVPLAYTPLPAPLALLLGGLAALGAVARYAARSAPGRSTSSSRRAAASIWKRARKHSRARSA